MTMFQRCRREPRSPALGAGPRRPSRPRTGRTNLASAAATPLTRVTCCGWTGWPDGRHEQELLALSELEDVLDGAEVVSLLDQGLRA